MLPKTIICHFYNEEWLLPFWLKHHRDIFENGIMIDYHSTDRSVEVIREYCPHWQIVTSKNLDFSPYPVDQEVEEYEKSLHGWRIALNVTEFLFGNYTRMNDRPNAQRFYVGQYMMVDMERDDEPKELDVNIPLYKQRHWGYGIVDDFSKNQPLGSVPRAPRSVHNYPIKYGDINHAGRHYPNEKPTYDDLAILYYGYGSIEPKSLARKMQIQTQIPASWKHISNHVFDEELLLRRYREEQQPMSRDMAVELKPLIDAHESWIAAR